MQPKRWKVRLACGLSLLLLAGCFPHSPYGMYGPGAYPGAYGTPPAGATVPNGATILPPSTLTQPGTAVPQWQSSQDPISPGLGAPVFDPNRDGVNTPKGSLPVPDPIDPGDLDSGKDKLELNDAQSPFGLKQPPQRNTERGVSPVEVASGSSAEGTGTFVAPVSAEQAAATRTRTDSGKTASPRRPNPYAHDREGYRWLRGKVDYDEADKTWNIIYNNNPDRDDRFGGSITLIDDERLSVLNDNDVVLVHGQVDSNTRDRLGKPRYHITDVARLVPKEQMAQDSR